MHILFCFVLAQLTAHTGNSTDSNSKDTNENNIINL